MCLNNLNKQCSNEIEIIITQAYNLIRTSFRNLAKKTRQKTQINSVTFQIIINHLVVNSYISRIIKYH